MKPSSTKRLAKASKASDAISQPLTANSGERSEPPSNRLRFNIPTMEETFKGERSAWRNAHKERQRREARNRERGTGNRLDVLCHIDGKPCPRAAKCAFRCFEVCQNLAETTSSCHRCAYTSSCASKHPRPRFACGIREANITE